MGTTPRQGVKGLRQFLNAEQQRDWIDGKANLSDADERSESLELRFKYAARFEKLLRRPQADAVLEISGRYGADCIPIPRMTERYYWSVSCLPSTSDKPLVRVNASWMELFTLYADRDDVRGRFIVHLSGFTTDGSAVQERLDEGFLEESVGAPENVSWSFPPGADMLIVNVCGAAAIGEFLAHPRVLQAVRTFNLTHMNRGRNAYQASHCYSVADHMVGD